MKWIKKNKIISIAILVILILVGIKLRMRSLGDATSLTEPLKKGSIIEGVYGIGTVNAIRSFNFKTGVASTVRKLFVKEGDSVKRGQHLIDLDGMGSIAAPFDGTVTYLPVRVGETVFAQSTVLIVTDLQDRYITVSLEQRGVVRVHQGQKAKISFDSMRDQTFEGTVESVYSNDANFLVRIGITSLPPQILPGMSADVAIGISEHQNVLLIPIAALDSGKVLVKRGSRDPVAVDVKTGIVGGVMAEVVSGDIKEGDVLVIQKKAPK